jgi:hypothetical protein
MADIWSYQPEDNGPLLFTQDSLYHPHWRALCGRHQVIKKNYWDNATGKLNVYAIVQAATRQEKLEVFRFLLDHFGYHLGDDGVIDRR